MALLGNHAFVALQHWPAVILAALAVGRLKINLFQFCVTDVADPHVASRAIEAEAPRIAEPVRPDLTARAGLAHKRIGWRNGVRLRRINVDAKDLAENRRQVLRL